MSESVEEAFDGGELEMVAAQDEIVALAGEGEEVEAEGAGGGAGGDADVGEGGVDAPGGGEVAAGSGSVVAADLGGHDAGALEAAIEELAAAGAGVAIGEGDIAAGEVGDGGDFFGIAAGEHETFLPDGESEDGGLRGDGALPGPVLVVQVSAGDVDHALLEELQGDGAIDRGGDKADAGALQLAGEDARGGIAAGDEEAGLVAGVVEHLDGGAGGIDQEAIGREELPGGGNGGDRDHAAIDGAELDGRPGEKVGGRDEAGFDAGRWSGPAGIEVEELFDGDFEEAGEAEGDGGVGDVAAGFHGVDGLAADAGAAGELGGGDAALPADSGESAVNGRFAGAIMVN